MLNTFAFPSEIPEVQHELSPTVLAWRRANQLAKWLARCGVSREAMLDLLETATVRRVYGLAAVATVRTLVGAP